MGDPNLVLLAGDTHGSKAHTKYIFDVAQKFGAEVIVQLGDFGYWPHTDSGQRYVKYVAGLIDASGIPLWWLSGNHENYDAIDKLVFNKAGRQEMYSTRRRWKSEFCIDAFVHLPRGHSWTWNNIRFCAFGGAASIDKEWRVQTEARRGAPRTLWWPQELITEADLIRFESSNPQPVDIMLTHDCPIGVDIPCLVGQNPHQYPSAHFNRVALATAVDLVRPQMLVHGHYHDYYHGVYEPTEGNWETKVIGLNCDGTATASWLMLDLEAWRTKYGSRG